MDAVACVVGVVLLTVPGYYTLLFLAVKLSKAAAFGWMLGRELYVKDLTERLKEKGETDGEDQA